MWIVSFVNFINFSIKWYWKMLLTNKFYLLQINSWLYSCCDNEKLWLWAMSHRYRMYLASITCLGTPFILWGLAQPSHYLKFFLQPFLSLLQTTLFLHPPCFLLRQYLVNLLFSLWQYIDLFYAFLSYHKSLEYKVYVIFI